MLTVKQLQNLSKKDVGTRLSDGNGVYGVVRATEDGIAVLFRWRYRFEGKHRDFGCGTWPASSLSEIREARRQAESILKTGADPMEERRAARMAAKAEQAEELARIAARIVEVEARNARMTVKTLFERWERLELKRRGDKGRKDDGAEARRSFEKDIFPFIGDVAAEDVKRSMIAECLDRVVERGSPVLARNLLGDLRQMFGFAIKREYVENDPTSHLKRDDFGKKTERDRVLNDDEIKQLVEMLPKAGLQDASVAAVWIMLSTCCRVGEISRARWSDVDLDAGTWRIPPDNSKNGKEHTVFLSEFAEAHFRTLRKLATEENGNVSAWVMPASHKDGHVCLKSLAKQIGDRQRGEGAPMKNRSKLTDALILPRGKWTPHDLRRTGATLMGGLGVRPDVIEKCLNHVEQNALVRIYQRQSLEAEQREAWRLLGERLALLLEKPDNVVTMKGKRKGAAQLFEGL